LPGADTTFGRFFRVPLPVLGVLSKVALEMVLLNWPPSLS
jgi:hypothetical protein